jgi:DNA polymerase-3 subunit beta
MATATKERKAGITLDRTTLSEALAAVLKAVPARSPKPVLQNVLLGNGLLTGTDLELRIDREIDYHGDALLLPAAKLSAILRAATGDEVTLTPKGSTVTVRCGSGSWTLPTELAAEFPTWEPENMRAICRLPADQFARAARATAYATDTESSRYALGGVLIEVKDGNPTWVATDGRRLACVETETDQAVDDSQTIVPGRVIAIAAGMAHGDGSVQVEANASEVRLTLDGVTITGRLVEGRFPRWRDVVGQPEGEASVLNVADLLSAVDAAAIVTSEQSKGIDLAWTSDTLTLAGRSAEYGESRVSCDVVSAGTTSSTKLDPKFLHDFLRHLPADEEPQVDVYVADAQSRVLLKCGPYTGVIMPLAAEG